MLYDAKWHQCPVCTSSILVYHCTKFIQLEKESQILFHRLSNGSKLARMLFYIDIRYIGIHFRNLVVILALCLGSRHVCRSRRVP